jgi:hypothetical protein
MVSQAVFIGLSEFDQQVELAKRQAEYLLESLAGTHTWECLRDLLTEVADKLTAQSNVIQGFRDT